MQRVYRKLREVPLENSDYSYSGSEPSSIYHSDDEGVEQSRVVAVSNVEQGAESGGVSTSQRPSTGGKPISAQLDSDSVVQSLVDGSLS